MRYPVVLLESVCREPARHGEPDGSAARSTARRRPVRVGWPHAVHGDVTGEVDEAQEQLEPQGSCGDLPGGVVELLVGGLVDRRAQARVDLVGEWWV